MLFLKGPGKKHYLFFFLRSRSRRSSRRHYTRSRSRSRSHRRSRSRSYSRDYRRRHSHSHSPMSTRRRHIGNRVRMLQRRGGGVNRLEYVLKSLRSFRGVFHKIILLPARVYLKDTGEVNCHLVFGKPWISVSLPRIVGWVGLSFFFNICLQKWYQCRLMSGYVL